MNACGTDLKKLLDAVDQEVKDKGDQTVVVESRGFNKDLYFNPDCWRCPNPGCDEFGRGDEVDVHNWNGCEFRIVPCISEECSETVPEYLLSEHLIDWHSSWHVQNHDDGHRNESDRRRRKVKIYKVYEDRGIDEDRVWPLREHCHPNMIRFFPRFIKQGGNYYMYLRVITRNSILQRADHYSVDLDVTNANGQAKTKITDVKVYEVDMPWKDVLADGRGVLAIHNTMAAHYECEDRASEGRKKVFRAHFTIKEFCYPIHDINYYANEDSYECICGDNCRQKDFHNK